MLPAVWIAGVLVDLELGTLVGRAQVTKGSEVGPKRISRVIVSSIVNQEGSLQLSVEKEDFLFVFVHINFKPLQKKEEEEGCPH